MNPLTELSLRLTRRQLLANSLRPLGAAALASLIGPSIGSVAAGGTASSGNRDAGLPDLPHFTPKAKRVIYLFMAGGPSQIDTFDFHPKMRELHGQELPKTIRGEQRVTGMTSGQKSFPVVAPMFEFKKYGHHQTYVSELLPHIAQVVDDIAIVKSVHTEAINHDPAITYGLGSPNHSLPAYVVMITHGRGQKQALYDRLWGSGFLPTRHQGVKLRAGADPVLYLRDPEGIDRDQRRRMLDRLAEINQQQFVEFGDPETETRIAQYEMAFRMQTSVPELVDLSDEPERTFEMYGPESRKPGTFARNCILARRLAERGVPFTQLFHEGWDQHNNLPGTIRYQTSDVDQPSAALVQDLKQRGLLADTLVIWGGEFGRTIYSQGQLTKNNHGRDHHGRCFTVWLAGAGIKPGIEFGRTDDFCYNIVENPVHIRDLNATILNQLGIDHRRLTFKYQGLDQSITGVLPARPVKEILA